MCITEVDMANFIDYEKLKKETQTQDRCPVCNKEHEMHKEPRVSICHECKGSGFINQPKAEWGGYEKRYGITGKQDMFRLRTLQ